ncbi:MULTISPECIES: hypothetical protein [unclassified Tolypothrix]|uniref:hypothetical protein n=1 Tax=unclassified Tolypothrix TaxID=2649714 RepID=UPI0005EAC595|nr:MULTISPECIES: hypothetical protein [unclassified Tolypothrix]BAY95923.1 hypothetical protein NIES3275_80000 [Microchaete diplosiphon NIES-3275]EKE96585.1 hypothetical protein FDUTEX481_06548 [Tolypothrix sp. PCC 7601]MBE9084725.1 hypothetical protein [Tolypothrix sp. LEGE 11397]UYD30949.1 hypothetical protein HGR01_39525 [Tolypothrix sp. PCC 7712]UYD38811.1 hypothetical protein HG267_40685 [Tolypothrix sp. PCC 7601]
MNTQPLPELVAQAQQLLTQIRQHPQYQRLNFDCDVTLGDVSQFFNTLQCSAAASTVDVSTEGFFQ